MQEPPQVKKRTRKCSVCGSTDHTLRTCRDVKAKKIRLERKKEVSHQLHYGAFETFGTQVTLEIMAYLDAFSLVKLGIALNGLQSLIGNIMCGTCSQNSNADQKRYAGCQCGKNTFGKIVTSIRSGKRCMCCGECLPVFGNRYRNLQSAYLMGKYPDQMKKNKNPNWRYLRAHEQCQPKFFTIYTLTDEYLRRVSIERFGDSASLWYCKRMVCKVVEMIINNSVNPAMVLEYAILKDVDTGEEYGYRTSELSYYLSRDYFDRLIAPKLLPCVEPTIRLMQEFV